MDRATLVKLRQKVMTLETHQKKLGGYDANAEKLSDLFEICRMLIDHLIELIPEGEYRREEAVED